MNSKFVKATSFFILFFVMLIGVAYLFDSDDAHACEDIIRKRGMIRLCLINPLTAEKLIERGWGIPFFAMPDPDKHKIVHGYGRLDVEYTSIHSELDDGFYHYIWDNCFNTVNPSVRHDCKVIFINYTIIEQSTYYPELKHLEMNPDFIDRFFRSSDKEHICNYKLEEYNKSTSPYTHKNLTHAEFEPLCDYDNLESFVPACLHKSIGTEDQVTCNVQGPVFDDVIRQNCCENINGELCFVTEGPNYDMTNSTIDETHNACTGN